MATAMKCSVFDEGLDAPCTTRASVCRLRLTGDPQAVDFSTEEFRMSW
jgi:hypothetical protein